MKHALLLELLLHHEYYTDGFCPDVAIIPSPDTARLLGKLRCLVRSSPGALRVYTPLVSAPPDPAEQPLFPRVKDATLVFRLEVQSRDFWLFTELSGMTGTAGAHFSSAGAGPGGELKLFAGAPDQPSLAAGTLPGVELRARDAAAGPASYRITFKASQAPWTYYCVTDSTDVTIVDNAAAATLSFVKKDGIDPKDAIGQRLKSQYPSLACLSFVSSQPVSCREEPRKQIYLKAGDARHGPLPNPSFRRVEADGRLVQTVSLRTRPADASAAH